MQLLIIIIQLLLLPQLSLQQRNEFTLKEYLMQSDQYLYNQKDDFRLSIDKSNTILYF